MVGYPLRRKYNLKAILKGQRRIPWPEKFRSRYRIYGFLSLCLSLPSICFRGAPGDTEMAYPLCPSCHKDLLAPVAFLIFEDMIIETFQETGQSLLSNTIQEKTEAQGGSDLTCIIRDTTGTRTQSIEILALCPAPSFLYCCSAAPAL